jgi:SHS2 domain-containing protein
MTESGFKEVSHTADLAVQVWAPDLDGLFNSAAQALYHLLGVIGDLKRREKQQFSLESCDDESMLVLFLNELLYFYQQEGCVLDDFTFTHFCNRIAVDAWCGNSSGESTEIKAATYHGLDIHRTERGLETIIVFDV